MVWVAVPVSPFVVIILQYLLKHYLFCVKLLWYVLFKKNTQRTYATYLLKLTTFRDSAIWRVKEDLGQQAPEFFTTAVHWAVTVLAVSDKMKPVFTYDPVVGLLGTYTKEFKLYSCKITYREAVSSFVQFLNLRHHCVFQWVGKLHPGSGMGFSAKWNWAVNLRENTEETQVHGIKWRKAIWKAVWKSMTCERKWWRQDETKNLRLQGLVEKEKQLARTRKPCVPYNGTCVLPAVVTAADSTVAASTSKHGWQWRRIPNRSTTHADRERSGGRDLENYLVLTPILLWMENLWSIKMCGGHQLTTFLRLLFSRLWISSFLAPWMEMLTFTPSVLP